MFCHGPLVIKVLEIITEIPDSLMRNSAHCDSNQDGEPVSLSASTCDEEMSQIKKTFGNDGKERFSLVYEV